MTAPPPSLTITPPQWAIVQEILHKHVPHCEVWAFGSRAKGTAKAFSDLDLAIIAEARLPNGVTAAMADDFTESDLPWKVDIVEWATTSAAFREIIAGDKLVVQKGGV
ncbi:MAG: hypothetical protein B7Z75_13195 [Acidocella sp. 20-57-95]|nr:MAG: hypothetical protein B7Z75_13195 [Acidocella sp. 20-57-95]OYV61379.1 MAG: hypothetical protein B7Z71_04750 [Acidocella sp. 21-58-7]HQT65422.1 nucleotidyltransferase domain-containing protein [Acidocella sp.]